MKKDRKILIVKRNISSQVVLLRLIAVLVFGTLMSTQSVGQCSGNVYDSGGASGNYSNNEDIVNTYYAPSGSTISLIFNSVDIENNYDFLYIHDGPNTSSSVVSTITGTSNPGIITSTGNSITLRFTSDGSVTEPGYDISLNCSSPLSCGDIVSSGLIAYYDFKNGSGNIIEDQSQSGTPLNLTIDNTSNTNWLSGCGVETVNNTIASSPGAATKIISAAKASNAISIEAWVRTDNLSQSGPARIVTISSNTTNRNITLGQENNTYAARVRTSSSSISNNGLPQISGGVVSTSFIQHVVYTFDGNTNTEKIFVDNVQVVSGTRAGDLSNWDNSYKLAFFNELSNDRPWLGNLHSVSFYNKALNATEIAQNFNSGSCCTGNEGYPALYDCEDGVEIEMFFTGIQNEIPKTLSFNNVGAVDSVLVEIVYKGSNPGNTIYVQDDSGNSYANVSKEQIGWNAHIYTFELPSTTSVSYANQTSESSAQSLLAFVYKSGVPGKMYTSIPTNIGGYNDIQNLSLPIPYREDVQDITIAIPISEVTYDNRGLNFYATAGTSTASASRVWTPGDLGTADGCCVDSIHLELKNVEPNVGIINIEVESPGGGQGQSYVIAGLVFAEIQCFEEEICDDNIDNDNDGDIDCEDLDCGLILNREFENGTNNWNLYTQSGSSATVEIDESWQLSGGNSAFIDVNSASGTPWHIQFVQSNISLIAGRSYTVYFDAKSTGSKEIVASLQLGQSPWTSYGAYYPTLTTESTTYQYDIVATETTNNAQLYFGLADDTKDVWIDNVQVKEPCLECIADAGSDQTHCNNAIFEVEGNSTAGATGVWSVVSGDATPLYSLYSNDNTFTVEAGTSATLRWTVSNGSDCNVFDDVILTNTANCPIECIDPININGDLEDEGNITNFDLTFEGYPAAAIEGDNNPAGWDERYGNQGVNTSNFNGAFYIDGNVAHSGDHSIYMKGAYYCLSPAVTTGNITCGKVYRYSMWVAPYTYGAAQNDTEFAIEYAIASNDGSVPRIDGVSRFILPKSNSINDLNWQRVQIDITIPSNGYDYIDFYYTTYSNYRGVFVDDVCITEEYGGTEALANADTYSCSNNFDLSGNSVQSGQVGAWSVIEGDININDVNSSNTTASFNSGSLGIVRWTVSDSNCSSSDDVIITYQDVTPLISTDEEICEGENVDLTISNCTSDLEWSNGETGNTITVSPTTTTTYTAICTAEESANLVSNGGFESSNNLDGWQNWGSASITTNSSDVHSGSRALMIDATSSWGGFGGNLSISPGESFTISFWGKTTNANKNPNISISFLDSSWNKVVPSTILLVTSYDYQKYTFTGIAPPNAQHIEIGGGMSRVGKMFIDDVVVTKALECERSAEVTVVVNPVPSVSATNNGPISCARPTVTLTANPVGMNYSWSGGGSGRTKSVTTAGEYFVTITTPEGCESVASTIVVGNDTEPSTSITPVESITCDNPNVVLEAAEVSIGSGTDSGAVYNWSNGATGRVITVTTGGTYTVTVTATNGCTDEATIYVIQDNELPTVSIEDEILCNGESKMITPNVCESYPDIVAQRPLALSGWNNVVEGERSALVGDGQFCFTIDEHTLSSAQMIGLNADPYSSNSYTNIDYALYVQVRADINRYRLQVRESGTARLYIYNSATLFTGSEICIKRTGTQIEYLKDGVSLYTSTVNSTADLYYDHSIHSGGGVWSNGYAKFSDISLCGEMDVDYAWSTGSTDREISVSEAGNYSVTITDAKGCTASDDMNVSTILVEPGLISGDENNCTSYNAQTITSYSAPSSTSGTYSMKWQSSTDNIVWTDISGQTGLSYTPGNITNTTYFRRVTTDANCLMETYSNVIIKEVDPTLPVCLNDDFEFGCEDGYRITPAGIGIEGVVDPEMRLINPLYNDYYIIQATFEGGAGSPEQVVFTNENGVRKFVNLEYFDGESGVSGARYFKTIMPATDSLYMEYDGDVSLAESLVSYGVSQRDDYENFGKIVNTRIQPGETYSVSFPLEETIDGKVAYTNVTLSGIEDDGNELIIRAYGKGAADTIIVTAPNQENTLVLEFSKVEELAPDAEFLHIEIESPASSGKSALLNGYIGAQVNCDFNLVVTGETDIECAREGDTITYNYTVYNFADVEFTNFSATSSMGGAIDFGVTVVPANTTLTTTQEIVITSDMVNMNPLVNDIFVYGWNFAEFGIKPKSDGFVDTLVICEICDDNIDNDGDGLVDCLDPDCNVDIGQAGPDVTICVGEDATLTASGGDSYVWSNGIGAGREHTVSPATTTTYTVTITKNGCSDTDEMTVFVNPNPTASASNNGPLTCNDTSVTLTANPSGMSYEWQDGSTGRTRNVNAPGTYSVTVTNSNGCSDVAQTIVNQDITTPTADAGNDVTICPGGSATLTASGGGTYNWSNSAGNTASVTVNPSVTTTYTVTVTSSNGCIDTDQVQVEVVNKATASVTGGNETICSGETSTVGVTVSGGTGSFTYQWQYSNNGVSWSNIAGATTSSYTTDPLFTKGYFRTVVTDSGSGCGNSYSDVSIVDVDIESTILATTEDQEICIGESVDLFVNEDLDNGGQIDRSGWTVGQGSNTTFYRLSNNPSNNRIIDKDPWGNDAVIWEGTANLGGAPDAGWNGARFDIDNTKIYRFSVWVNRKVMGDSGRFYLGTRAYGSTNGVARVSNNTTTTNPYFYVSSNPATQLGEDEWVLVVGHVFPHDHTGTSRHPDSGRYTANEGKTGEISLDFKWLPESVEALHRTYLYHSYDEDVRQQWVYPRVDILDGSEPSIDDMLKGFDVNGGLGEGADWKWYDGACGTNEIGTGKSITVTPTATTTYFVRAEGDCNTTDCREIEVVVNPLPNASINGNGELNCNTLSLDLTAKPDGMSYLWEDGSTAQVLSVTEEGDYSVTVTDINGCENEATTTVERSNIELEITGDDTVCIGETTNIESSQAGSWSSSDDNVATISTSGTIVATGQGTAIFTFTNASNGCTATSEEIVVVADVDVSIDFNGSQCYRENGELTAVTVGGSSSHTYTWTGPNGFSATGQTITIPNHGNYSVVVDDAVGCSGQASAFIYEEYEPFIFSLNTTVCEGEEISLSVYGQNVDSYAWDANAGNSDQQAVTVVPEGPSTTYSVTVTNNLGCTVVTTAEIFVDPKPEINLDGPDEICIGATTQLTSNVDGNWSSSNSTVASISSEGLITGNNPGTATFKIKDALTGCYSDESVVITVGSNASITITGDNDICMGNNPSLTASITGGTWSSGNESIATIDQNGEITPLALGVVEMTYTPNASNSSCYTPASYSVEVHNLPNVDLNGPSIICEGEETYVTTSYIGIWTSSDESVATISNGGVINGISEGTATISFTSNVGCIQVLNTPITVVGKAILSINGSATLCVDETANLSADRAGVWISSNPTVASINGSGMVTAKKAGVAEFSFIESTNGCLSDDKIIINVEAKPIIGSPLADNLCIDEETSITSNASGTWESTDESVATINETGVIKAIGPGTARFIFTNSLSGCQSDASSQIVVNPRPTVTFAGPLSVCKQEQTSISPSNGGTWTSSDVSVATIDNNGIITAQGVGTVTFTFTLASSGCPSLVSDILTVLDPTSITLDGSNEICVDETTNFSPSTGGTWISSNNDIATISNDGEVTGVNPGIVTFTFQSDTGCASDESVEITIQGEPTTTFTGTTDLCIGGVSGVSSSADGEWYSSDETVATVDENGLITAIGIGNAEISFTSDATGCTSILADLINVSGSPVITIEGPQEICIGDQTYMNPANGGSWISSDNSVATISNSGVVTGMSPGKVAFTYFNSSSGCASAASDSITVMPRPSVFVSGDNTICIGTETTLSPSTGGTWTSDNDNIATVTNSGVVTAVSQGIVRFTFVSDAGCSSNETSPIIIYGEPTISINGPSSVCLGENLQMLPNSGGTWTSSNDAVATITNAGLITSIASGTVTFTFQDDNTGCTSQPSETITIHEGAEVSISGPDEICVGSTTTLLPSTGGIWQSLNPSIASISNDGIVTGVTVGQTRFIYTDLTTGCVSDTSQYVTVNGGPVAVNLGDEELCIGSTTTMSPSTGGTWLSTAPSIASIDDNGLVTALAPGLAKFQFIEDGTGCQSILSDAVIVNNTPTVNVSGSPIICIGTTTFLTPTTGGQWSSSDESIATVSNDGTVTSVGEGVAYFTFIDDGTGCSSDGLLSITVETSIDVQVVGDTEICAGYTTILSPSSGGIWTSSNSAVATVSNLGVVTGHAPGEVSFTFTDANTGCSTGGTTDPITVSNCINHDFNVALVDQVISGNLNTNDNIASIATYSNLKITEQKPLSSIPVLNVSSDGSYTFEANKPGKYLFRVPVCLPPMESGCPSAFLEINVLDDVYAENNPTANLEFATTYASADPSSVGQMVAINPMSNDKCVYTGGCDLDMATMSITKDPINGSVAMNNDLIEYTPNAGFVGSDTVWYSICVDGDATKCNTSQQVIVVGDATSPNTIVAADDFNFALKGQTVSGNLMSNDMDPEGDVYTIQSQGSLMTPIVTDFGSYYIESDGSYEFTPSGTFSGAAEIIYTVCDNNSSSMCTDATLHLQVFDDLALQIRVYLEGALTNNGNETSIDGHPLMRADLRSTPHDGNNYIPMKDPYTFPTGIFDNAPSNFDKVGPGLMAVNTEISDSTQVFSVTGDNAIVDWVWVELRDKDDYSIVLATRAGLVQRDGDVVDLDGTSQLRFQGLNLSTYYIAVKHRNHLGVMSMIVNNGDFVDFTSPETPVFNFGTSLNNGQDYEGLSTKDVKNGYKALWAGDMNNDGKVKFTEPGSDQNVLYADVLFNSPGFLINYNQAHGYHRGDYNLDGKAKYTNPDDDKNMLFTQVLLFPGNTSFVANFGNLLEQIPPKQ